MIFQRSQSDSKSPQVSWAHLSTFTGIKNDVVFVIIIIIIVIIIIIRHIIIVGIRRIVAIIIIFTQSLRSGRI